MKKLYYRTVYGMLVMLIACHPPEMDDNANWPPFDGTAYEAVYVDAAELARIESQPARALRKPGKIYVRDNYLFVNELGEGIHIIDNRDPASPEKISFLRILANYDIAVKGNYLYADNARDLVVLNIADPLNIRVVKRIENAIIQNEFPPHTDIWFKCPDPKKGPIVSWEKVNVRSAPACFR